MHEVFLNHRSPFRTLEGTFKVRVDYALGCNIFLNIVVNNFTVVLCTDTCKALAFSFRNAKLFKSVLDVIRNIFPAGSHVCLGFNISNDFLYVQVTDVRSPFRLVDAVEKMEGL